MTATLSRRAILSAAISTICTGCGDSNLANLKDTARFAWGTSSPAYDPEKARQLPYATLDAKIGTASPVLIVLGEVDNQKNLHWFSADRAQIVTDNLRIIKTAGLPTNLSQTIWIEGPPLYHPPSGGTLGAQRLIDCIEENIFGCLIKSTVEAVGQETIDIYGKKIKTLKLKETNYNKQLDWHFTNYYWIDNSGFSWKSTQTLTPSLPEISIQVLKPYAP